MYVFREGLPGWIAAGYPTRTVTKLSEADVPTISTAELKGLLDGGEDFVLLDIRSTVDQKFWIDDRRCLSLDLNRLHREWQQIPAGKKIVVLDMVGKRTTIAARFLSGKGFKPLVKVGGGIAQYLKDGYPVRRAN